MSLPDNIRSLFGAIPGAMPRGSAISSMAGPGFITGAEANQTHAQAGTRAGGWAEGVGSNATDVNTLAGNGLLPVPVHLPADRWHVVAHNDIFCAYNTATVLGRCGSMAVTLRYTQHLLKTSNCLLQCNPQHQVPGHLK